MVKTPGEPVFKKIIREIVREEIKPELEIHKIEILSAFEKFGEKILVGVAQMRDEIITSNDKVAGEIRTMREEQTLLNARSAKINDIEDEVEKLRNIHPHNSHQPVTV